MAPQAELKLAVIRAANHLIKEHLNTYNLISVNTLNWASIERTELVLCDPIYLPFLTVEELHSAPGAVSKPFSRVNPHRFFFCSDPIRARNIEAMLSLSHQHSSCHKAGCRTSLLMSISWSLLMNGNQREVLSYEPCLY